MLTQLTKKALAEAQAAAWRFGFWINQRGVPVVAMSTAYAVMSVIAVSALVQTHHEAWVCGKACGSDSKKEALLRLGFLLASACVIGGLGWDIFSRIRSQQGANAKKLEIEGKIIHLRERAAATKEAQEIADEIGMGAGENGKKKKTANGRKPRRI